MNKNDGGPAFPRISGIEDNGNGFSTVLSDDGMSLRDYFAAKAMQGFIASFPSDQNPFSGGHLAKNAADFYAMADAMLAERQRGIEVEI